MMIANHGILCTIGFLGLLPLGVLIARWTRWFAGHAVIQAVLSGPIIVAGVALGIHSVDASGGMHLDDTHKKLGVALFVLYFVQLLGGAVIHFFKPKNSMRRPAQNYAHAFLGLLIIALAFWQVRTGYRSEYPEWATGRVPMGVNTLWIVWVVLIPVAYFAGLALVPRQFRQEGAARDGAGKQQIGGGGAAGSGHPGPEMREGSAQV
ncbi:hypothetical protein FIBSPDRAFT_287803 [Athelia psychrophila]|uniref:Cytochrome b561 domain-containing protein n=1 Tax=Athelia psychrophila TaxID=1759441 RepID=A0A167XMA9_9AGAM|nr:hypothetical protein FIBSPDRAFT_287803 [Fibularhizoctonia sp. CBS 109695]